MNYLLFLYLVIVCALLNSFRGGGGILGLGSFTEWLPGRPLYYSAVALGLVVWPLLGGHAAIVYALCNFAWGVWAWGRWYMLNRRPRSAEHAPSAFEDFIEWICGTNDYYAFTLRNFIGFLPSAILMTPWVLVMIPLQTLVYDLAIRLDTKTPNTGNYSKAIPIAELLFGACQGVFLAYMYWTGISYTFVAEWISTELAAIPAWVWIFV